MATSHVSGALALLKAAHPDYSPTDTINRLIDSVDILADLDQACLSRGRLNLRRALDGSTNVPANDDFANAEPIVDDKGTVRGRISLATQEDEEPAPFEGAEAQTVWYKWQPNSTGVACLFPPRSAPVIHQ